MILKLILILCTKSYYIIMENCDVENLHFFKIINEMRLNKCFYKKVYENIKINNSDFKDASLDINNKTVS